MEEYKEIENKILAGDELTENERKTVARDFDCVYQEEEEDRRWTRTVKTVVRLPESGELYCIEWE